MMKLQFLVSSVDMSRDASFIALDIARASLIRNTLTEVPQFFPVICRGAPAIVLRTR